METKIEEVVRHIAETIQREATVRTVFGEPIKLEERTIVPVALIHVALGGEGAGGGGGKPDVVNKVLGFGGGGGLDVSTVPIGFLSEKDGDVRFTPIVLHEVEASKAEAHGTVQRILEALKKARSV